MATIEITRTELVAPEVDYEAFTDEELLAAGRGLFRGLDAEEQRE